MKIVICFPFLLQFRLRFSYINQKLIICVSFHKVIDQKLFREDADTCLLEGLEDTDIHARVEGAALHSSAAAAAAARNVFETDQCARCKRRRGKTKKMLH